MYDSRYIFNLQPDDIDTSLDELEKRLDKIKDNILIAVVAELNKAKNLKQIDKIFTKIQKKIEEKYNNFREMLLSKRLVQKDAEQVKSFNNKSIEYEKLSNEIADAQYEFVRYNIIQQRYRNFNYCLKHERVKSTELANFKDINKTVAQLAVCKNEFFYQKAKVKLIDFIKDYTDSQWVKALQTPIQQNKELSIDKTTHRINHVLSELDKLDALEKKHFSSLHNNSYSDLKQKLTDSSRFIVELDKRIDLLLIPNKNRQVSQVTQGTLTYLYHYSEISMHQLGHFFRQIFQKTSAFFVGKLEKLKTPEKENKLAPADTNPFRIWRMKLINFFQKTDSSTVENDKDAKHSTKFDTKPKNTQLSPKTKPNIEITKANSVNNVPLVTPEVERKSLSPSTHLNIAIPEIRAFINANGTTAEGEELFAIDDILKFMESLNKKYNTDNNKDNIFFRVHSWMVEKKAKILGSTDEKERLLLCHPDKIILPAFSDRPSELETLLHKLSKMYGSNFFTALKSSPEGIQFIQRLQRCKAISKKQDEDLEEISREQQKIKQEMFQGFAKIKQEQQEIRQELSLNFSRIEQQQQQNRQSFEKIKNEFVSFQANFQQMQQGFNANRQNSSLSQNPQTQAVISTSESVAKGQAVHDYSPGFFQPEPQQQPEKPENIPHTFATRGIPTLTKSDSSESS